MNINIFWLSLFLVINTFPMERSPLPANYEITTLANEMKTYKCLLCDHRPVKRETSLLNHWVQAHNKTFDYTLEIWKEIYLKCAQCATYHPSNVSLKTHMRRHHTASKKELQEERLTLLEKKAIFTLWAISKPS